MRLGPIVWYRRDLRWAFVPFAIEIAGSVLLFFGECDSFEGEAKAGII